MFDSPFDFLPMVIAIVAFIVARKAFNQASALRTRLDAIEAAGLQTRPAPPPLTPLQEIEQPLAASSPGVAPEQPAAAPDAAPIAPTAEDEAATRNGAVGGTTT